MINEELKDGSVRLSGETKGKIREIRKRRIDDKYRKNTIDAIVGEAMDLLLKKTARK